MTVSSSNNKNTYNGDGSTTVFAYTFRILDQTHALVQLKNETTGAITTQTITTHYTVSGVGDSGGGNITFVTAPTTNQTVILTRTMPFQQGTDYVENDSFPADSHEEALDELTMNDLELKEQQDRTLKIDADLATSVDMTIAGTTTAAAAASKYITFNATGTGLVLSEDTSVIGGLDKTDGTFYVGDGTTVVAETGATARTSMGVAIGTDVQAWDADLDTLSGAFATASGANPTSLTFKEAPNNGTDAITLKGAASTAEITINLPSVAGTLLVDVVEDTSPQLGADLDTNSFDIQFDDATGIRDDSDNEQLIFQKTASAVNHFEITNAATGNDPKLSVAGSDTNIDLEIESKGSGDIILDPGSTGDVVLEASSIKIDTTEGILDGGGDELIIFTEATTPVNYIDISNADTTAAPTITGTGDDTNVALTLDSKGSGQVNINTGGSQRANFNASGFQLGSSTRVNGILDEDNLASDSATDLATQQSIKAYVDTATPSASDTTAGLVELAVQSEMETGTSTTLAVVPGRQHYHPASPKAWVEWSFDSGTPTIGASYNITSLTDTGTGDTEVVIATDFSSAVYATLTNGGGSSATDMLISIPTDTRAAGTQQIRTRETDSPYSNADSLRPVSVCFFGDQ